MKHLVFIKFGGSFLTDKTKPLTIRDDAMQKAVAELTTLFEKKSNDIGVIIGNGAGSFGHFLAKELGTSSPYARSAIHSSVVELHQMFVSRCLQEKLPVFSFHASSLFSLNQDRVQSCITSGIEACVRNGGIAGVYGDIMHDADGTGRIFSTERIFRELIPQLQSSFRIQKIIHISTVPGVFDENKQIIPEITTDNWSKIQKHLYTTDGFDVTGGMQLKIEESLALAKQGIESVICTIEQQGVLERIVNSEAETGTRIR